MLSDPAKIGLVTALLIAVYALWNSYQAALKDYIETLKQDAADREKEKLPEKP